MSFTFYYWNIFITLYTSTVKFSSLCAALLRNFQRKSPKRSTPVWNAWEDSTCSAELQVIGLLTGLYVLSEIPSHLSFCCVHSRTADPSDTWSCSGFRWAGKLGARNGWTGEMDSHSLFGRIGWPMTSSTNLDNMWSYKHKLEPFFKLLF